MVNSVCNTGDTDTSSHIHIYTLVHTPTHTERGGMSCQLQKERISGIIALSTMYIYTHSYGAASTQHNVAPSVNIYSGQHVLEALSFNNYNQF